MQAGIRLGKRIRLNNLLAAVKTAFRTYAMGHLAGAAVVTDYQIRNVQFAIDRVMPAGPGFGCPLLGYSHISILTII
jgi:hypothetical protein